MKKLISAVCATLSMLAPAARVVERPSLHVDAAQSSASKSFILKLRFAQGVMN